MSLDMKKHYEKHKPPGLVEIPLVAAALGRSSLTTQGLYYSRNLEVYVTTGESVLGHIPHPSQNHNNTIPADFLHHPTHLSAAEKSNMIGFLHFQLEN